MMRRPLLLAALALLLAAPARAPAQAADGRVDAATLSGKFVVGFQGWFMCPNDGRPRGGWVHWFTDNRDDAEHVHFDLLPDVSELTPAERCPTGLRTADGRVVELFSDQNPQTVLRQFEWLRHDGIESVALERFVLGVAPTFPPADRAALDRVLDNVRMAAERTGRAFFVMYDIAGADPARWADDLAADWQRLLDSGVVGSPLYQHHRGRPVLAIAGVGASDRPGTAAETLALLARLRRASAGVGGVTLLGTTATGWRTLDGDAKPDPAWAPDPGWARAYRSFDVLSPWTVGRYRDAESFARFRAQRLLPDMAEARRAGIEYMPVIFPGFSWRNLSHAHGRGPKPLNEIPRRCGRFLWLQATADVAAGATMLYGAMLDEVDEGTALFKLVPDAADLPVEPALLPLDDADCAAPADWYLRLSGTVGELLRGRLAPTAPMPLPPPR
jgi:hypothetical protein